MQRRLLLSSLAVFVLTGTLFFWLSRHDVFPDPDAFYHVKASQVLLERGIEKTFPWLSFTTLNAYYADQHFLYHVALLPFISFGGDPLFSAKVATAVFAAVLFAFLAVFLQLFRVRFWWLFLCVLLATNPFLFRILLVKAPALSLTLLFLGITFLFAGRRVPLAIVSFFYAWTYGGFALLAIAAGCYLVVASIKLRALSWRAWRLFLTVLAGLTLGIVLNPYFPQNLSLYWQQLVQIGLVNYQEFINVGGEWHPYATIDLFSNAAFVSISIVVAFLGLFLHRSRQSNETWTVLLLTVFMFFMTLKSRRYVEIYVPLAVVFSAFAVRDAWPHLAFRGLSDAAMALFRRKTVLATVVVLYCVSASSVIVFRDFRGLANDLANGSPFSTFRAVGEWLKNNTPKNAIIVHSDWDDFPALWYWNSHNRYIVGLDPTFMFLKDRSRYERWASLTTGNRTNDATTIITRDLQSRIVVVTKDHEAFRNTMDAQHAFLRAYEDDEVIVYVYAPTKTLPDTAGL